MTVEPQEPIPFAAPDISEEDIKAVVAVLERRWVTTGEECFEFERELAAYLDVAHVVAMSSCTAALETALAYLRLPAGSRVGVPTWTFASSALAAHRHGLVPVLLDVDPSTLNVSPEAVDAAGTLDALVVVHFGGVPVACDVHALAAARGLAVVEDAAHALGARDGRGIVAGRGSTAAAFSFYATKNLTSAEGGALATDDEELARFARVFRQHGMSNDAWARYRPGSAPRYDVVVPGIKANFPDVLAALARSQLRRFASLQSLRRRLVTRYREHIESIPDVTMVPTEPHSGSADHLVVVRLAAHLDREQVLGALQRAGIGVSVHFVPLHHMTWFRENAVLSAGGFPGADAVADSVLSLPLHTRLRVEDVDRVCESLGDAVRG